MEMVGWIMCDPRRLSVPRLPGAHIYSRKSGFSTTILNNTERLPPSQIYKQSRARFVIASMLIYRINYRSISDGCQEPWLAP